MNWFNSLTIQGWMLTHLKLSGNPLVIYAYIFGVSQDGQSGYRGTLEYLGEFFNISARQVMRILNQLCEDGLICKRTVILEGRLLNEYVANLTVLSNGWAPRVPTPQRGPESHIAPPIATPTETQVGPDCLPDFEEFWKAYIPVQGRDGYVVPKGPKKLARDRYLAHRKKGVSHAEIIAGLQTYLQNCQKSGVLSCQVAVFLSKERWKDEPIGPISMTTPRMSFKEMKTMHEDMERERKMQELIRLSRLEAGLE